jgi:RNA polymerase sigma-70 factor (ECF subfamily)
LLLIETEDSMNAGILAESSLIDRLRSGDEAEFEDLITTYHRRLLPLARFYAGGPEAAEDVLQETWLAVVRGIHRFEERATLRTWLSRIVMNRARSAGVRANRFVAFADLSAEDAQRTEPAVDSARFCDSEPHRGHCSVTPEHEILTGETMGVLRTAVEALPEAQRLVITLRDINGWSAEEVCSVLDLSETNQRVLLHRARSKVRNALEDYFRTQEKHS